MGWMGSEDPIPQEYTLEVSSPGINRKLTRPEHFEAFLEAPVHVKLIRPLENGVRELEGILIDVLENGDFEIITDEENRRYCPWLVKSIESPIEHPIDYDHVFAEAVALGQEVMSHPKGEPLEWTYWLTRDDIELMRSHNRLFMVANYAEEQILRYYRVPEPDTPLQFIKFRYSAEILERIGVNPALRQNLNNQNIGNVMKRLGFKKIHKKNGNGWAVIEKEGSEINNDSFIDPNDTMED